MYTELVYGCDSGKPASPGSWNYIEEHRADDDYEDDIFRVQSQYKLKTPKVCGNAIVDCMFRLQSEVTEFSENSENSPLEPSSGVVLKLCNLVAKALRDNEHPPISSVQLMRYIVSVDHNDWYGSDPLYRVMRVTACLIKRENERTASCEGTRAFLTPGAGQIWLVLTFAQIEIIFDLIYQTTQNYDDGTVHAQILMMRMYELDQRYSKPCVSKLNLEYIKDRFFLHFSACRFPVALFYSFFLSNSTLVGQFFRTKALARSSDIGDRAFELMSILRESDIRDLDEDIAASVREEDDRDEKDIALLDPFRKLLFGYNCNASLNRKFTQWQKHGLSLSNDFNCKLDAKIDRMFRAAMRRAMNDAFIELCECYETNEHAPTVISDSSQCEDHIEPLLAEFSASSQCGGGSIGRKRKLLDRNDVSLICPCCEDELTDDENNAWCHLKLHAKTITHPTDCESSDCTESDSDSSDSHCGGCEENGKGRCPICTHWINSMNEAYKHLMEHHSDETTVKKQRKCDVCKTFVRVRDERIHKQTCKNGTTGKKNAFDSIIIRTLDEMSEDKKLLCVNKFRDILSVWRDCDDDLNNFAMYFPGVFNELSREQKLHCMNNMFQVLCDIGDETYCFAESLFKKIFVR